MTGVQTPKLLYSSWKIRFIMWLKAVVFLVSVIFVGTNVSAQTQNFNDNRCICLCPHLALPNVTHPPPYIKDVPPNLCNCENVILPQISLKEEKAAAFCVRCDCKYENRNTGIIKVVVIIVIWIISLLVVYMLFLICLDPLLNKRAQSSYTEHTNEDLSGGEGVSHAMGVRSNVLNRVGHQQDKWKKQVREQRRNIYDRHTMLN